MARYFLAETLKPEFAELARYYSGVMPPAPETVVQFAGQAVNRGELSFSAALDELVMAALAEIQPGQDTDIDEIEARLGRELADAAGRDDIDLDVAAGGGTVAELRREISPEMADRLGITDPSAPLTEAAIANLLCCKRVDGGEIEGKEKHKPRISIAEVFGIDTRHPLMGAAMRNVLEGRRADGKSPATDAGRPRDQKVIDGAGLRFRSAMDIPRHRDATPEEIAHLVDGRTAQGGFVDPKDFRGRMHATNPPVGFIDVTFSADKSVSVAWALAPTEAERAFWLDVHRDANATAMAYVEKKLGFARLGHGGRDGNEAGNLAWVTFQHYTARPAVDLVRRDEMGREYTDTREVHTLAADPQLHSHNAIINAVLTESGRIGSLDLDKLEGFVKEGGAVYQAYVATLARSAGVEMRWDRKTGAAVVADVPASVRDMFSKRSREALTAAREIAKRHGMDWDALSGERQIALIKAGAEETRQEKERPGGRSDFEIWREQAKAAKYHHPTMLRPDRIKAPLTDNERWNIAYEVTQGIIEEEFKQRAKISAADLRTIAARGFIEAGIGNKPGDDIAAALRLYGRHGVRQDGEKTSITIAEDVPIRGKKRWSVTTALHETRELEFIKLARAACTDRSQSLSAEEIDREIDLFLRRNPHIDRSGAAWQGQHAMIHRLGSGGRLAIGVGAAGAGKSTVLEPLVAAWKAKERTVYGATVAHRQARDLAAAGIDEKNRTALEPFIKRVKEGKYALDRKSVVVVDELSLVGTREQLELLRLQEQYKFALVEIGDPKQLQSVEAGPVINLFTKALGEKNIPEVVLSVRQKAKREQEITGLFRQGKASEALEMKRTDGTAVLVAGGWDTTVKRAAEIWYGRTQEADRLTVSTETNAAAHDVGLAIRALRREKKEIVGQDHMIRAVDGSGARRTLALAAGDRVRLFDRVHDADAAKGKPRKVLANNGEIVEVRSIDSDGMRVRNSAGEDGTVAWKKIRETRTEPVRLAYGYANTVNVSQGVTSDEHIHVSQSAHGLIAYTAMSRHTQAAHLIVDESAVRRRVAAEQSKKGVYDRITEESILAKLGHEMSAQPIKASSLDFLRASHDVRRGAVREFQRTMAVVERIRKQPGVHVSAFEHMSLGSVRLKAKVQQMRL